MKHTASFLPGRAKLAAIFAALLACLPAGGSPLAAQTAAAPAEAQNPLPIERFALYIGSNDGGSNRETLRYAGTDAARIARTMSDIGGVKPENGVLLVDPSQKDIDRAIENVSARIAATRDSARRTEFLFYYSGHSDENELLLGSEAYSYDALKDALGRVPSDVHVVMLDSCYSGNFVRTKGGSRQAPFLMDDSTVVQGHAYLSSSSEHEASQESDLIQSSYFTQALVTGLRGAADASGDGRVSLNELYHYAFNDTLSKTEASTVGPQHPSYNITLVGSGDLILTDLAAAESLLIIPSDKGGSYFIRTKDGALVSQIDKYPGSEVMLALPAAEYTITLVTAGATLQSAVSLATGERRTLDATSFAAVSRVPGRARGDLAASTVGDAEGVAAGEEAAVPFKFSVFPGLSWPVPDPANVSISLGLFMAKDRKVSSLQASSFIGVINGSLTGFQYAGFLNILEGSLQGFQYAGFLNSVSGGKTLEGAQIAGFLNASDSGVTGAQVAGFLNSADGPITGAQVAGFLNAADGPITGAQVAGFLNTADGPITGAQVSSGANNADGNIVGAQVAGFLNRVDGTIDGAQVSCGVNIAGTVHGAQIGLVNFADSNTGVSIGLLNFIRDGIMSPGIFIDSDDNLFVQYQGGTPFLFTTFLAGSNREDILDLDAHYGFFGFGIGSRIGAGGVLSLDLEIMSKQILDFDELGNLDENDFESEESFDEAAERFAGCNIPSARITGNLSFSRHFSLFVSYNADIMIDGYNNRAFTYGKRGSPDTIRKDAVYLYSSWAIGLRF